MDFSLFAHMERLGPEQTHPELYAEFLDLCTMADEGGMRAIWTGEHHGMEFTIAPNPFITITDLARRTRNVRLGTGTVVAPFWHPIKLAGEAAMTDLVTDGRLELGLARGAYSYEYERLSPGLDAWQAGQRLRELAGLLRPLWAGDCAHEGTYFSFPSTTSSPSPVQPDGPPIWIAARDPNSHEFAVKSGFNVQVTPLWQGSAEIESLMEKFNAACAQHSGPRPKIMILHHCYVGSDEADVDAAVRDLSRYYAYFGAWFQNKTPVSKGLIQAIPRADIDAHPLYNAAALRRDLTVGTAQEVIDRLKRIEDLGYDEFSFWVDSGMTSERKKASLARFIDKVMPAFGK
jgi:alkanesulfonate monooxygenase SsuD/methylene tetrahydromethanopterin reductase-like flavin-dependent oxidoreductase (luciferase family)